LSFWTYLGIQLTPLQEASSTSSSSMNTNKGGLLMDEKENLDPFSSCLS
jgi:hypothetical protein